MIGWVSTHALVERHFTGASSPRQDRRLFRHLPGCAPCRARYRVQASLEALDDRAEERARERLARGIFGTSAAAAAMPERPPARSRGTRTWFAGLGLVFAGMCVVMVARRPRDPVERGLTPPDDGRPRPTLSMYRVPAAGRAERAGAVLRATDSLAFAYTNPTAQPRRYLMVFAFDQSRRVYWYWPAWETAQDNPASVSVEPSDRPVELTAAISHPLAPGPLTMVGLFSDRALTVREVEGALARGPESLAAFTGGDVWMERVEVLP